MLFFILGRIFVRHCPPNSRDGITGWKIVSALWRWEHLSAAFKHRWQFWMDVAFLFCTFKKFLYRILDFIVENETYDFNSLKVTEIVLLLSLLCISQFLNFSLFLMYVLLCSAPYLVLKMVIASSLQYQTFTSTEFSFVISVIIFFSTIACQEPAVIPPVMRQIFFLI